MKRGNKWKRSVVKHICSGTKQEYEIELGIDWSTKEVNVHIEEMAKGISDWSGLAVQSFGPMDEVVFRTKGIPSLFTHWWYFVRGVSRAY